MEPRAGNRELIVGIPETTIMFMQLDFCLAKLEYYTPSTDEAPDWESVPLLYYKINITESFKKVADQKYHTSGK